MFRKTIGWAAVIACGIGCAYAQEPAPAGAASVQEQIDAANAKADAALKQAEIARAAARSAMLQMESVKAGGATGAATAERDGLSPYLSASLAMSMLDDLEVRSINDGSLTFGTVKDAAVGLRLATGLALGRYAAVEAGYVNLGRFDIDANSNGTGTFAAGHVNAETQISGYELSLLGKLPVSRRVSLSGRAGYWLWESETTTTTTASSRRTDRDDGDALFGAGLEIVEIVSALDLRLEYIRYRRDGGDLSSLTASAVVHLFGG